MRPKSIASTFEITAFFLKAHAALFQSTHYEQLQDEFEPSALLAHERRGVDFKRGKQTLKSLHSPF
jgi:hypothetical protein